jgi:dGTPase
MEIANYAVNENSSLGRAFPETPHPYRTAFERDRDRIIHSSAFRRLEGKTQVFMPGLDDYYRTRLTHSIEVAQIGKTIAKALNLNESLTDAICLAHDLGHSPFGHTGEEVLDNLMVDFGGFEHNRQSLRIVDLLEHPYPDFFGLNLMYETRLGLAKHRTPYDKTDGPVFAQRNCSLEGQVSDIADRIAYNCHDLEDGMRAHVIHTAQLKDIELFAQAQRRINADAIDDPIIARTRTAKTIIDTLVSDCIDTGRKAVLRANIETIEDVYNYDKNLILLSSQSHEKLLELEKFLLNNFYLHESVTQAADDIRSWLSELFDRFCQKPQLMPGYFQKFIPTQGLQRTVCDYIAGMTDRFCLKLINS